MTYTVKEIAEKMGVTEHTIRYYSDQNLLPCTRDKNNHRLFDQDALVRLNGIQCLRRCGISIEDIRDYFRLCEEGDANLTARYEFMLGQRTLAYARLKEAQEAVDYTEGKVGYYEKRLSEQSTR